MRYAILETALEKGVKGEGLTTDEALVFTGLPAGALYEILPVTERIRAEHRGVEVNLCSIVNAKSGLCKEDCSFCSQSVKYATGVESYSMAPHDTIVSSALEAEKYGAREFSIVTSGTAVEKGRDVEELTRALKLMKNSTSMERCASLGILSEETLRTLKESGLESYHHNLETSRSFFPEVCTTHDYDDDVEVVRRAKALGFHVCSGGIFGLGEKWHHRVELFDTLRGLDVDSVPLNFLNPRPGTPLESARHLTPADCLRIIALARVMMPAKDIIVCGGREVNLRDLQVNIFAAGANGMMVGNYLTTRGRNPEDDLRMISDLGLRPRGAREDAAESAEGGASE